MSGAARRIVVDWGTSRLRACLVEGEATILDEAQRDAGIQSVPPGGFPDALQDVAGAWLAADPGLPVLLVGMVGSRNGWAEAPYAPAPAGAADLARRFIRVRRADGGEAAIAPGVICDLADAEGAAVADVMRGEETLALGSGCDDGVVVQPGTHSKWIGMRGGRIDHFMTAMTGEAFALFRHHSLLGRLAETPEDEAGFARGLKAARRPGGLLHQLFEARTGVLAQRLKPAAVGPFLSGLLIGGEIAGARQRWPDVREATLVADGALGDLYAKALDAFGVGVVRRGAQQALLAGARRILAAGGQGP